MIAHFCAVGGTRKRVREKRNHFQMQHGILIPYSLSPSRAIDDVHVVKCKRNPPAEQEMHCISCLEEQFSPIWLLLLLYARSQRTMSSCQSLHTPTNKVQCRFPWGKKRKLCHVRIKFFNCTWEYIVGYRGLSDGSTYREPQTILVITFRFLEKEGNFYSDDGSFFSQVHLVERLRKTSGRSLSGFLLGC